MHVHDISFNPSEGVWYHTYTHTQTYARTYSRIYPGIALHVFAIKCRFKGVVNPGTSL